MRIGILQTGHVNDALIGVHGDYPQMFRQMLTSASRQLEFEAYDVMLKPPESIDCDAYLITGSRHSVYDDLPWIAPLIEFLKQVLAHDKKIIGICFGHQLMAHFFGGQVGPAKVGWGVGVRTAQVKVAHDWMTPALESFALISSHRDQVVSLPAGAEVFAGSDFCPVAGFTMGDQVLTLQGHPEFSIDYISALMAQRRDSVLGEAVYQQAVESLKTPTNEATLVRWILNFIAGEGET